MPDLTEDERIAFHKEWHRQRMTIRPLPAVGECDLTFESGDVCHGNLRLCEGGYVRDWSLQLLDEGKDGVFVAIFHGLEDFSDEGDCEYWVECRSCGQRYEVPDEWEWE